MTSISMDINDLVVGKVLNFTQVAISSRAQGLMNLFHRDIMGPIKAVAYPAFSRAHREHADASEAAQDAALERQYIASVSAVTAIAWPFYAFMGLFPLEVLRIMFGPQWDASAPLVPLFCAAGAFSATISLIPTLMLAAGNSTLVAAADLTFQPLKAAALTLVLYYFRALEPFAMAFVLVAALQVPYFYAFKQRCLPSDYRAHGAALGKNILLAILTIAPAGAASVLWRPKGGALSYALFFGCAAVTALAWGLCLYLLRHPLAHEIAVIYQAKFKKPA